MIDYIDNPFAQIFGAIITFYMVMLFFIPFMLAWEAVKLIFKRS